MQRPDPPGERELAGPERDKRATGQVSDLRLLVRERDRVTVTKRAEGDERAAPPRAKYGALHTPAQDDED